MAERDVDILVVGGGLAGASCAEGQREEGFDGSVLLVGREPHPPYERPPCSKDLLRGESEPDDAHLHPDDWYADNNIELQTRTSVMKLDPATKTAELAHKQTVRFDRALLATGANINRLRVEGGVTGLTFDERRIGVAGDRLELESAAYDGAADRYEMFVAGGANNLNIGEHQGGRGRS